MERGVGYFNGTSTYKAKLCVLHLHDACDTESYCSTPYLPCRSEKLRRSDRVQARVVRILQDVIQSSNEVTQVIGHIGTA